ncbi:MAG: rhomboid family intramembrane serine protease [Prevotellaceae bacterium]|jgi:membrane associated rhomboid family serine protease|nr:rhomboid family intramembrane serine protease [Prevotellaceae bacterium]
MTFTISLTLAIVLLTVGTSVAALRRPALFDRLLLSPYRVAYYKEWYRVLTHGFVHAGYVHLAVNMLVLYSLGEAVERLFAQAGLPRGHYLLLYFGGMAAATLTTLAKRRRDPAYAAVGASGAVSAVLFAYILLQPWGRLYLMGLIPIPCAVFGPLYLLYSSRMSRRPGSGVNHAAHLYGALFGLLYPVAADPYLLGRVADQLLDHL